MSQLKLICTQLGLPGSRLLSIDNKEKLFRKS